MKYQAFIPLCDLILEGILGTKEYYFGVSRPSPDVTLVLVEKTLLQVSSEVVEPHFI
jgi:hypothetical protein